MSNPNPITFDDLDDTSLVVTNKSGRELAKAAESNPVADEITMGAGRNTATVARYKCGKCHGSGKFYSYSGRLVGDCRTCGGTGLVKTDPEVSRKRKEAKIRREQEAKAAKIAAWNAAHPVAAAWLAAKAPRFNFAADMARKLAEWGTLTDGQLAAVERCAAEDAERDAARATRKADVEIGGAGFDRMVEAFAAAKLSGLKNPKFHVGAYVFSLAKETSTNAGCLYVKNAGVYIGKVTKAGGFFAGRDATQEDKTEIARIGADPLGAAIMHGKQTGQCSCCGRQLENAESVELGIGPICRAKWGLA